MRQAAEVEATQSAAERNAHRAAKKAAKAAKKAAVAERQAARVAAGKPPGGGRQRQQQTPESWGAGAASMLLKLYNILWYILGAVRMHSGQIPPGRPR